MAGEAFQKYQSDLANLDFDEQRLRRLLAQRLAASDQTRSTSLKTGRENSSSRGILQSSIGLQDQVDRNTTVDRDNAAVSETANNDLTAIQRSRAQAVADYMAAKAEEERQALLAQPVLVPDQIDPTDPLGWKKIAEERRLAGDPAFGGTPNPDPLNWQKIAEEQAKAGNPAFQSKTPRASFNPLRKTSVFG